MSNAAMSIEYHRDASHTLKRFSCMTYSEMTSVTVTWAVVTLVTVTPLPMTHLNGDAYNGDVHDSDALYCNAGYGYTTTRATVVNKGSRGS